MTNTDILSIFLQIQNNMRITIIDDSESLANSIEKIFTTETTEKNIITKIIISSETPLSKVISDITESKPELILMDDDLRTYYTGKDIVDRLSFPKNIIIGTSGLNKQEYCGHKWPSKTIWEKPSMKQVSLIILFDIVEKIKKENSNFSIH